MPDKVFCSASIIMICFHATTFAQEKFDFYLSNKGNNAYPGTSQLLPKQTIGGIKSSLNNVALSKGVAKLGLKAGDIFNESLTTSYPVWVNTFNDIPEQKGFAILDGGQKADTGWLLLDSSSGVYQQKITYEGFTGYGVSNIGSYSYIYVVEIDRELEKTAPFTARKILNFVSDLPALENTAGSFYIPFNTTDNPVQVCIHTSDGNSPNSHKRFRYEVTIRDCAVNSTYQPGNRFENLWVTGFGAGIGMLPGGNNSYYNKIVFGPGAGIHHLVARSGVINHSLFLPAAKNTNYFAVVFYDVEGLGRHCTIKNSMFLDIPQPVYAHTSYGTNYGAVEIDNVLAFADSTDNGGFMYTSNNDSVLMNSVYIDGYRNGYNYGNAKYAAISNSCFKDVAFGIAFSALNPVLASVKNVLVKTKGAAATTGIVMQQNTDLTVKNSVIHILNQSRGGAFINGAGNSGANGKINATGNVFICDIDGEGMLMAAATNTDNGIATTADKWDNNVYVLLRGKSIYWRVTSAATIGGNLNVSDFAEWKRQSGQDNNSLFFDLRNNPRGLKAIFADPDNGNYDLANTPEGRQVAALRAGMSSPVTCFLQKPTYEHAAGLIQNDEVLSVNTCRNPCSQNAIRIDASFDTTLIAQRTIQLNWRVTEQKNIDHYQVQRALENAVFSSIGYRSVTTDSLYSFIDNIQPGVHYRYRLLIKPKGFGECYSETRAVSIDDSHSFTIYPNPSAGKMLVSLNGHRGTVEMELSNLTGQIIYKKETYSSYSPVELDISNQPKGVYLLKVKTVNGITAQKVLLQ